MAKTWAKAPVLVHYIGHDRVSDEWVGIERLRSKVLKANTNKIPAKHPETTQAPPPDLPQRRETEWEEHPPVLPDLSGLVKGLKLQAMGEDEIWYVAEVVQVATDSSSYAAAPVRVHYMGWPRDTDEWIGIDRIRSKHLQALKKHLPDPP